MIAIICKGCRKIAFAHTRDAINRGLCGTCLVRAPREDEMWVGMTKAAYYEARHRGQQLEMAARDGRPRVEHCYENNTTYYS